MSDDARLSRLLSSGDFRAINRSPGGGSPAAGQSTKGEIAALLFITEETEKNHVKHILEKLGASDQTEAVTIGFRCGIIRP